MLDRILDTTRGRVAELRPREADLRSAAEAASPVRGLAASLLAPGLAVIAEIKRRSPSAGALHPAIDAAQQAKAYERGGAAAISVLTEPYFFDGSLADLIAVKEAVAVPVLRKDFLVDEVQVWESRAAGADAVLLIVAALDGGHLRRMLAAVGETGMEALVEAHTEDEVVGAIEAGARIVGVNNRDLATFVTDPATAEGLAPLLEHATVTVAESGVSTPEIAARMARAGYDAILVGEGLVRSGDPAGLVGALREQASKRTD
ncbi:MAG: indole-3-glycerol phosphate synthase TrpC [Acidimicrobiia bacterium]